jgi:hypothetical protein
MGAKYDWLEVSKELLPKYLKNEEDGWQVKGLSEELRRYKIDRNNQLWVWAKKTPESDWYKCLDRKGKITFYKITGHIERWTEYEATIENGFIVQMIQTQGKLADHFKKRE